MRSFGPGQRRARLAVRHALTPAATARSPIEVARRLVALHSTDAASVYLSVWSRMPGATVAEVEHALYEQRTLVRMLGMRRTVFVLPVELAPIVHAACTEAIAARERRKLVQYLEEGGIARDGARWLAAVEAETRDALAARGRGDGGRARQRRGRPARTAAFRRREEMGGQRGGLDPGAVPAGSRRRHRAGQAAGIVAQHAVPLGADARLATRRPAEPAGGAGPSRAGPAVARGLRSGDTRRHRLVDGLDGRRGEAGAGSGSNVRGGPRRGDRSPARDDDDAGGDLETGRRRRAAETAPWVALLPALDPTVMGWAGRDWFLGQHRSALFDRSGNAGPTVWWDGRVVGGWAQRRDGEIAVRLLEDVGADAWAAICGAATRLQAWLGAVRVTPRFRTPLERELSA